MGLCYISSYNRKKCHERRIRLRNSGLAGITGEKVWGHMKRCWGSVKPAHFVELTMALVPTDTHTSPATHSWYVCNAQKLWDVRTRPPSLDLVLVSGRTCCEWWAGSWQTTSLSLCKNLLFTLFNNTTPRIQPRNKNHFFKRKLFSPFAL
jgi:hypothetical protein